MDEDANLPNERKRVLRTRVRHIILNGRECGQPMLLHIPDEDIPDTPLGEFERALEDLLR
jgi:hypothetical protein